MIKKYFGKPYYFIIYSALLIPLPSKAQKIVKGFYITHAYDTVFCSMQKLKKLKEETSAYKEVQILNGEGKTAVIYPNDIYAYVKDGVVYKSMNLFSKQVFVKLLVQGKANLYFHSDEAANDHYIFHRSDEKYLIIMDYSFHFTKVIGQNPGMNGNSREAFYIKAKDKRFIIFFSEYFKDYEPVVRKIKSEFYTKDDMIDIFTEYNDSSKLRF